MKRNTYNYRQDGMPANGTEEMYAFALERYHNLLREAEGYRMTQDPRPRPSANGQSGLPFAHLLNWARMQLAVLTHAA